MTDLKVYYEDNHLLVVEKPENMPTCEDESKDYDLLSLCKDYLKEKYNKPGNVFLGLVHRLDRPVAGIMVFAKTSKAASRLSKAINEKKFRKEYLAVVEDNGLKDRDILLDNLLKDEKTNTVKVDRRGKQAELAYETVKRKDNLALVHIYLKTGRSEYSSHQETTLCGEISAITQTLKKGSRLPFTLTDCLSLIRSLRKY